MNHRQLSFAFFLAVVIAVGIYFFQIVQPFLLPMLMSGTLALLMQPVFSRVVEVLRGRRRIAAALVTSGTLLLVALPLGLVFFFATQQLIRFGAEVAENGESNVEVEEIPIVKDAEEYLDPWIQGDAMGQMQQAAQKVMRAALTQVSQKTTAFVADAVGFIIALAILVLSLYYFLSEGPTIAEQIAKVLPFEAQDEAAVAKQFETICRGVVIGTLASGLAQATLVAVASAILQIPGALIIFCVTLVFAIIPFLGAGAVYVPISVYLLWNERYAGGISLLVFGLLVVSTVDNLIRAYTIQGTSRLHPLVGLVSALGAIKLVGLWGIFVGPVVAGIFYALLKILQRKMDALRTDSTTPMTF